MGVTVELDVPATMRDGVLLRANVYRPEGEGPWPTLLARLPYGKDMPMIVSRLDPVQTARAGFMVVIQDTRGRHASEGRWDPFAFERDDGYDSVEWAARLPGSNGRVGMYGDSYLGNAQWMAAIEHPPSLAAIAPALTWSEPLDGLFARGGALEFGLLVSWSLEQGVDHIARLDTSEEERRARTEDLIDDFDRITTDAYWALPADANPVLERHGVRPMPSVAAMRSPEVAAVCRVAGRQAEVDVPSFNLGGWYDIFLQGSLDNYVAAAAAGREARLVVGPWTHLVFGDPLGERHFGLRAGRYGAPAHEHGDVAQWQTAWLGGHLRPDAEPERSPAPVRIFVMGRNEWRDEPAWPLERAVEERWFLQPGGGLAPTPPRGDEPSSFAYDPDDPVPTVGGQMVMAPSFPPGPFDQSRVEARDDVLAFTSEPLTEELEVTGRVRLVLYAESSAPSTDWVGRLCDVDPDGRSLNLCDGIVRVSSGADGLRRHELDLWSTSNVFLPGHRLRLQVTSSCFPRWDRNLNTGDQHGTARQVAHQRVHHDASHASYLSLPVVPSAP
jgi:putative CocE/NonD family hydrolase